MYLRALSLPRPTLVGTHRHQPRGLAAPPAARQLTARASSVGSSGGSSSFANRSRSALFLQQPRLFPPVHYRRDRGNLDERTASPSFSSPEIKREGPLLLAFDLKSETIDTVEWVLCNFTYRADPNEKVEVVHVVSDPWRMDSASTSVGTMGSGLGNVVFDPLQDSPGNYSAEDLYSHADRTRKAAAAAVHQALKPLFEKAGIPYEVHIPYVAGAQSAASIGESLLDAADRLNARVLVVASHGPGAMAEYGSVARHIYSHAALPALLVPSHAVSTHTLSDLEHGLSAAEMPVERPPRSEGWAAPRTREQTPEEEAEEEEQAALLDEEYKDYVAPRERAEHQEQKAAQHRGQPSVPHAPPAATAPSKHLTEEEEALLQARANAEQRNLGRRQRRESAREAQLLAGQCLQPHSAAEAMARSPLGVAGKPAVQAAHEVLVVVSELEELEDHWQWIADNVCHKGDTLTIWHCNPPPATPEAAAAGHKSHGRGLASLPIALMQVLRARGLSGVNYVPIYGPDGRCAVPNPEADVGNFGEEICHDPCEQVAEEVCKKVQGVPPYTVPEGQGGVRVVCSLNYNRLGIIAEAIKGSVASHLSRNCPVPLLLLQPGQ